jgi:DNA modification methylase
MTPYYQDESATIYNADYRDIIATMHADVVITDPPYGVDFQYEGDYADDPDTYESVVLDHFGELLDVAPLVLVTPGLANMWKFPQPRWAICWAKPGSTRRSKLRGFNTWEPVLVYGDIKRPVYQDLVTLPTAANLGRGGETGNHPCPKPYKLLTWLIEQFTDPGDVVFDPFMGSGTTIKAAAHTGRKAVGIEVVTAYCDIAIERLSQQALTFGDDAA